MTTANAHLDPTRKHDFVFLIEAVDSNPNGDPDNGGIPRTDPVTGQGLITDVAIKRKIRNAVAMINDYEETPGNHIYVEAGVALNAQHERAYTDGAATDTKSAQAWMCRNFFDVRMFGAVMTTGKRDRWAGRVQGPVQIGFARSIDPVTPFDIGITRLTPTRQEDVDAWNKPEPDSKDKGEKKKTKENTGKETEMGSKHIVPYGLYKGTGHFSAPLAKKTGVTTDDLATFWRAFTLMFEHDRAAARAGLALRGLHIFTHDDAFGRAPAHELADLIEITGRADATARSLDDYKLTTPATLPPGITLTTLLPQTQPA
ncbi:type I-C CRISPR-associated protein Cas7/Csd2 [Streptomyces spiramenti]|uniref:Type I-C CRISPR-associated protein Cas7/Csd2 n=1 Tax=Streptomyces spiramenti TaxID=2720606 RepID=A0ABX1AKL7_9ACTN|nr:type I-C CRISPR-associated protein Cas7/Csd2 [Streptomyces spiramenti]NJP64805.1 type I-C CRISPR-associated protein Cas7/Csd2 [Streptomyces spiramenti]